MRIAILAFTKQGALLSEEVKTYLLRRQESVQAFSVKAYALPEQTPFTSVKACVAELFSEVDALVFIGAAGIAVRAIATLLQGKEKDPAVLVMDETKTFVIPILSGHLGGANQLAKELASEVGATAVITTATDCNAVFAVDNFAKEQHLVIDSIPLIKEVSGALLQGEAVGFFSEYPVRGSLPKGLRSKEITTKKSTIKEPITKVPTTKEPATKELTKELKLGIYVGRKKEDSPFSKTFALYPKNIVIGMGCKRNTKKEELQQFLQETLTEYEILSERVEKICSIEKKADEEGLILLAKEYKVPFVCFSAEELAAVPGEFETSSFVLEQVGVGNVCERSASLGSMGGIPLTGRLKRQGMTLTIWERDITIEFEKEKRD